MSTNLEYRERERQTRGRRQASEAQREKEQQRASARDKKQRRRISLEKQHENFVAVVRKWEMLPVSKVKMCFCSKKKSEQENKHQNFLWAHKTFSPQNVQPTEEVSHCNNNNGKEMYKKERCTCKVVFFFCRIFRIQNIRGNILPKFIQICMETPCWCPPGWAPTWWTETNKNIRYRVLVQKSEFISRGTHIHLRWLRIINEEGLLVIMWNCLIHIFNGSRCCRRLALNYYFFF